MSRPRIDRVKAACTNLAGASRAVAATVLLGALLAGCSDPGLYLDRRDTIALGGGDSVDGNQIGQMVDPWPAHVNNKNLAFNGERMQRAIECYRIDKVTPPVDVDPSTQTSAPALGASGNCVGQMIPGSAQPAAGTAIGGAVNTSAYK
jgi:hypothetical protein